MQRITLEQQARSIERWKAANGITGRDYVPVNLGKRRTASKRALLSAMDEAATKSKRVPRFLSKF